MICRQSYSFALLLLAIGIVSKNCGVVKAYDWRCNLFCYNKGVCRHGHGKFGSYAGIDSQADPLPFEQELHDDGMYCSCLEGYTGLQCEIKYVTCGRDDHTCFNGSSCIKERASDNNRIFYRCQCDIEHSVMKAAYAGKYCEHIATTFCDGDGDGFTHGTDFCTNGGKCNKIDPDTDKKIGCNCPKGWEGAHCELASDDIPSVTQEFVHKAEDSVSANGVTWIVIGSLVGIFVAIYFRRYYSIKKQGKESMRHGHRNQEMGAFRDDTRDVI